MKKQKVMLLVNDTTYAYNLRKEVIEKLVAEGYEVVVVCALLLLQEELKALGCRLIGVETGRQGTNPVEDLKLFAQYLKILRKEKPDTVLTYLPPRIQQIFQNEEAQSFATSLYVGHYEDATNGQKRKTYLSAINKIWFTLERRFMGLSILSSAF